jgi:ABC-type multidrug transport system fused ATPase/permease subunit
MSRITNDTETIAQAVSFTLVNVLSGALLLVWIVIKMVQLSLPYALLSMVVLPAMLVATFWFSAQARKAFRQTRLEIGRVNADLQESISGVREVQAFGREEANIESFRESNAANRDANIRAVSFTAALAPTLEALGYVAIATVMAAGGLALLRGTDLFGTVMSRSMVTFWRAQRFNQPIQQISICGPTSRAPSQAPSASSVCWTHSRTSSTDRRRWRCPSSRGGSNSTTSERPTGRGSRCCRMSASRCNPDRRRPSSARRAPGRRRSST